LLLLAHEGVANQSIAERLGLSRPTVLALRDAFAKNGLAAVTGIRKRNRPGSVLTPELEQKIVDTTVNTRPGDGSTHWSVRMLARHLRISRTIVHRVWQRHDIQPHRVERFKLSNDPHFEEKVRDVVGLYLNPPERALVLCVDEKSQIQALDRTAPILPLRPGLPERQTHDYKRHGTTTLFAAFNILNGKVIGTCQDRHRSREFVRFLNHLEAQLPAGQDVHLIMDNYCTHKSAEVQRWLKPKKRRRFHFHFTPTSTSWLNQVERFFALITGRIFVGEPSTPPMNWSRPSTNGWQPGMANPLPSSGRHRLTSSSTRSGVVKNYLRQETRHSRRIVPITRSTCARCHGDLGAESASVMPKSATCAVNSRP
jgi:transposase